MNLLDRAESAPEGTSAPSLPVQVWILSAVLVLGLVAQYIGGEAAFSLLERGPIYSAAASALIEAMAMAEAFTLAMSYKAKTDDDKDVGRMAFNPFALGGLVISLGCSGIYNYVWVQEAVPDLAPYQIAAYAVGPLSALATAGLTLGSELREHLMRCAALEDGQEQQAQNKASAELARKAETERQARDLQARIKYEKVQAEIALELERMRLESQEHTRATKAQEGLKRKELKLQEASVNWQGPEEVAVEPEISARLPEWLPSFPADKAQFVDMIKNGSATLPEGITGVELAAVIPTLKSERNGRNWLSAARNGKE